MDIECARNVMITTEWQGISGTYKFRENGDALPHVGIHQMVDGKQIFPEEYN